MSTRTFLLIMTALAFLQGTILPSVFLEGLVILLFLLTQDERAPSVALPIFASGLVFDLLQVEKLGLNALLFTSFALLVFVLRGKTPVRGPLVSGALVALFALVRGKIILGSAAFFPLLITFLLTAGIFSQTRQDLERGGIRL